MKKFNLKLFVFLFLIFSQSLQAQVNWNLPVNTTNYSDVLTYLKARDLSCLKQDPSSDSNIPVGAYRDVIGTCTSSVNCFKGDKEYYHASGWLKTLDPRDIFEATAGGTANAITLTTTPAFTSYQTAGRKFLFKATNTNTGSVTVAINGDPSPENIYKPWDGTTTGYQTLHESDIIAGNWYILIGETGGGFKLINANPPLTFKYFRATNSSGGTSLSAVTSDSVVPVTYNGRFTVRVTLAGDIYPSSAGANISMTVSGAVSGSYTGNITLPTGATLQGGELLSGGLYDFEWTGSTFRLLNPSQTESAWTTWTVSGTSVSGGGTWTSLSNTNSYKSALNVYGKTVHMKLKILGTIAGAVNRFEVPLPVNTTYSVEQTGAIYCYQNSSLVGCYVNIEPTTDKMYVSKYDNSNFTAGANSGFVIDAIYRTN